MVLFGGLWSKKHSILSEERTSCGFEASNTSNGANTDIEATAPWSRSSNNVHSDLDDGGETVPSLTARLDSRGIETLRMCAWYTASYLCLAVVAYSFVFEKWSIVDSIYFATVTFTTTGYGDLEPSTEQAQLFTIFFAVYGVIILGIFIGIVGHTISEGREATVTRWKRSQKKRLLHTLFPEHHPRQPAQRQQHQHQHQSYQRDPLLKRQTSSWWADHVSLLDDVWRVCKMEAPEILVVMLLAYILGVREGWSLTSSMYFCIMSASTTGFGDYTPKSTSDKIYCIFFLPLAVAVFGEVLGRIATLYITRRTRQAELEHLQKTVTLCDLRQMDANHDGCVDREEFITFMLVALQKVDQESIDELKMIFHALDADGNGTLEKNDLVVLNQRRTWIELQRRVSSRAVMQEVPSSRHAAPLSDLPSS